MPLLCTACFPPLLSNSLVAHRPHLVPTVGNPCDRDGALVARFHGAPAGLHAEAERLQGRRVVPLKLTALENRRTRTF